MAIYNEILAGRFARGIQKILSMKGEVPVKQAAGEISSFQLVNDLTTLEHRIVLSVRSFARSGGVAAGGAGNKSAYRLRNPTGSNVVAVLEKLTFFGTSTDQPFLTRGPTGTGDLTTSDAGNNSIRDLRMGPINSSLVASSSTAAAVVGVSVVEVAYLANGQADAILYPNQEIVVAPGDVVTLYSNLLNQALNFNLMWRERALEESELNA